VASTFSLDDSGLTGGSTTLGSFNLDDGTGTIINPPVQAATRAHIRVDSIDIYSNANTFTEAIPGVTLDLLKAEEGETTTLNINLDKDSIKSTIEAFAKGYNEVMSFITNQSAFDGSKGGVLGGDAGINAIKRRLQSMLTQPFANSGSLNTLSQLGFETQKDGTLVVNDKTLSAAIDSNLDSVVSLLAGEENVEGAGTAFKNYLFDMTSSGTGMLKGKKDSIDTNLKRIDTRIVSMEARLEQRQKTMEAQFSAMETLVSGFNAQSSYLTQQMEALSNMMNYRRR
jgi:flagellar hook-associated protein 2